MNLNQNLSILFWLNKAKKNNAGLAPIWMRITVDGKRAECSVKKQIGLQFWDAENGRVLKGSPDADSVNHYLTLVHAELARHFNVLLTTQEFVLADDVKRSYLGIKEDKKTFLGVFDQFLQHQMERKEAGDISKGRCDRFVILRNKCADFIRKRLKKNDLLIDTVKLNFVTEFEHYLRTTGIEHNTAMKYAKDSKQVMTYAVVQEYIQTNPFDNFKCTYKRVKREFLNEDELDRLYRKKIAIRRLDEVRDCYLFSCYTGYAYSDAESLGPDDVSIGIDGNKWIIRDRQKTDTVENVPLLDIPLQIIEKYRNHPYCKMHDRLLPMNSNQRYNGYLKEVADLCEIKKNLTTHTARHTFATTVCLLNDIPMETTMELLGHTDIRTTQIYGKIVQKKISADMQKLRSKLASKGDEIVSAPSAQRL